MTLAPTQLYKPEHCLRAEAKGALPDQGAACTGILVLQGLSRKRVEEVPDWRALAFFKSPIPQGSSKKT
jgi:hypothetical protein